jgi:outer membrane protein OmpA-like peptidoglycan-associated protein
MVHGDHLLSIRFLFDIAQRPLVVINRAGEADAVVSSQFWFHSLATYTLANRVAFHMDLPILLNQDQGDLPSRGRAAPGPDGPTAFGDLRLGVRLSLLNPAKRSPRGFDLAIGTNAWLPTGDDAYTSDGAVRGGAALIVDGDSYGLYWAASAGVTARPPLKLGFTSPVYSGAALTFTGAAGVFLDPAHSITLGPELTGQTALAEVGPFSSNGTIVHLLFGAHYVPTSGPLEVGIAAGPDLAHGPGSGDYQVALLLGMVPERAFMLRRDRDRDGIPDPDDACPSTPGVRSDDPEMNGCPPRSDTDGDGIADGEDACPLVFGPRSPDPKLNGCPPSLDTDNDGVPDIDDPCPLEPGPAPPDGNGCPPPPKAELAAEQIVISQQVVFETGKAVLLPESDEILRDVARLVTEHPEIDLLEVQGHTDERGTVDYNRKLSQDRASSVVTWLVQHGIAHSRLQARGYGRDRPIADNSTEEGMQKNRRVEFHVLRTKAPPKP